MCIIASHVFLSVIECSEFPRVASSLCACQSVFSSFLFSSERPRAFFWDSFFEQLLDTSPVQQNTVPVQQNTVPVQQNTVPVQQNAVPVSTKA